MDLDVIPCHLKCDNIAIINFGKIQVKPNPLKPEIPTLQTLNWKD